jgi:plasmid maintenance system antidote protein VapI
MARPPKAEFANHPLKKLRAIFSSNGLCTQYELAALTGIKERTIHAIEAGNRTLTPAQLHKILLQTGAHWNGDRWMQGLTKRPFTAKGSASYREQKKKPPAPAEQITSADILCAQLRALLEFCAPTKFNDVVFALQDAQERIRAEFAIKGLAAAFDHTQLWLNVRQFPDGKIEVHREHPYYLGWNYLETSAKGLRLLLRPVPPWKRRKPVGWTEPSPAEKRRIQKEIESLWRQLSPAARRAFQSDGKTEIASRKRASS